MVHIDNTYSKKNVESGINPLREVTIPVTGLKIKASMLPNVTITEELANNGRIQRIATLRSAAKLTQKGGRGRRRKRCKTKRRKRR